MKMADDVIVLLKNNCEPINNDNGVKIEKADGDTKSVVETVINKTIENDNEQCDELSAEGVASEIILAGEKENHFQHQELEEFDGVVTFKTDNEEEVLMENCEKDEKHDGDGDKRRYMVKHLKKRSIKCLNKMQIMEDVREGCNDQPSSPGHAEQRSDQEKAEENGFDEMHNANKENDERNENLPEIKREETDTDMVEDTKPEPSSEETYSEAHSPNSDTNNKRKTDTADIPIKRLRSEIQENFASRDKILSEFIEMADCNNLEQINMFSEQLLAEVKTLNELAKEKEREWNNIIHLKKLKEELLIRMQRRKQVMVINDKSDYSELLNDSTCDNGGEDRLKTSSPHSILKTNLTCPQKTSLRIPSVSLNGERNRLILPKQQFVAMDLNGSTDYRQIRQRPTLDVQSIIADYRQQHPESVPRRGRRIRSTQGGAGKINVLNYSSMALGSGAQVRQTAQDVSNELGLLLNSLSSNRQDAMKINDSNQPKNDAVSFKDMLLQFAKLSQSERTELIQNAIKPPPPYPEVTVHPVPTTTAPPTNSLLHGILTKNPSKQNSKTSFSPTLARLLTAPERAAVGGNQTMSPPRLQTSAPLHGSNVSISEILSTSKARNEITITPVETQIETSPCKGRTMVEEETEDSADRLVIDESNEEGRRSSIAVGDNGSDGGDEVPQCQGCNQKPAQFVCAGCGNQWYCSRDCQVSSWDEHSEVCSG